MTDKPPQRPEGALLKERRGRTSVRKAASLAEMSEGRWRQIEAGSASHGHGNFSEVIAPADTLARMAMVVGASPKELVRVGREDAADELVQMLDSDVWGAGDEELFEALDRNRYLSSSAKRHLKGLYQELRSDEPQPQLKPGRSPRRTG